MVKLAIIDFCETIANFQTLDPFLEYVLKNERPVGYRVLCNNTVKHILGFLNRISFKLGYRHHLRKKLMVLTMRNIPVKNLEKYGEKYYDIKVRQCLIPETIHLIGQLKEEGYRTVIVSGGSRFYIRYFMEEYGIDGVVSAEIEIRDNRCTGRLLKECLGTEKVRMLDEYIQENKLVVSKKVCITDSPSDLPILNECERKIVISHRCHKEWVTQNMEEVLWE